MENGALLSQIILYKILNSEKPVYIHLYSHGWQYDYIEAKKEFNKFLKLTRKQADINIPRDYHFIAIYLHWPSASRFASSFIYMRDRALLVGSTGGYELLLKIQNAFKKKVGSRLVLMGHSLGALVVCQMLTGPLAEKSKAVPVDGLVMLEGAISMWSFCSRIPDPVRKLPLRKDIGPGRYWEIIRDAKVKGPIINVYSRADSVLRDWFELGTQTRGELPLKYRPAGYKKGPNNRTNLPAFGAIGGYGAHGPIPRVTKMKMKNEGERYYFEKNRFYNIDATSFIKEHMKFQIPESMWILQDIVISSLETKD